MWGALAVFEDSCVSSYHFNFVIYAYVTFAIQVTSVLLFCMVPLFIYILAVDDCLTLIEWPDMLEEEPVVISTSSHVRDVVV